MQNQWQNFIKSISLDPGIDASLLSKANIITDLSHLGLIKVAGNDAKKFLQGQLTCNLDEVDSSQSRLGAHCNPQGRIISLFRLFFYQDSYFLQMPISMIPIALDALKKYAIFFKLNLSDESQHFGRMGYSGMGATEHLATLFDALPQNPGDVVETNQTLIIHYPGIVPRYEIIGTPETMETLWNHLATQAQATENTVWQYINIISGIPQIFPETSGKFLPHEINLQLLNGISFNKGCYTGQEIIARMHYRGKLKKRMFHARMTSTAEIGLGDDIYIENNNALEACGSIVDRSIENAGSYQILIIADDDDIHNKPMFVAQNQVPLQLLTLPYENS